MPRAELLELAVDFDGDTQQLFRTGAAAVAVPGTALGLEEAHRRWGRMPWAELVAPAAALARDGFELTPMQGYLHSILDGLLRHSPEGDAMYGRGGRPYRWATASRSRISATRSTGSRATARQFSIEATSRSGSSRMSPRAAERSRSRISPRTR